MMKTKDIKKGISLIVLIITIIVVIILAAVVILTLSKNNPIESAKEARFKEDVRTFQDELAMTVSKQYTAAGGHRNTKISTSDFDEIKEYIPSFSEKYRDKFIIQDDELKYTNKLDDNEKEYAQSINVREKNKLLPDEFQQVEYIESTGTQYIDTKLSANEYDNIKVEIYGKYTASAKNSYIFSSGYYNSDEDSSFILIGQTNQLGILMQFGKACTEKKIREFDTDNHIWYLDLVAKQGKLDSTTIDLDGNIINFNYNYYLFSEYTNGAACNKAKFRMSYCKIKNVKNQFIRYYIPCYSKTAVTDVDGEEHSAGTVGLYDTVEGKFYTNKGTGEFIAGPDVNE